MSDEIVATVIHSPITLKKIYRQEFLDKINERAVDYYPSDSPYVYNFKRRFQKARKIPSAFIKKDSENGYIVLSTDFKRRFWKDNRTRYHYLVYKTRFGYWICTCQDYAFNIPKPCKHIMRVILFEQGFDNDDDSGLSSRMSMIFEDKDGFLQSIINYG